MSTLIEPRVLKGFRDFLPAQEIERALLMERLTAQFRLHGFVPIDTPVLEYSDILLRKSNGETEKQVFRFQDNGGRDVALRFDLTVPFARFTAEHKDELYLPFKRYHMAKVWRGEKPQAGRYREFVQCDFDIVGTDSAAADFEIMALMKQALSSIGVDKITIHFSHRGIFNRFLAQLGIQEQSEDILRTVDKLAKIGRDEVESQLAEYTGSTNAARIIAFVTADGTFDEILSTLETAAGGADDDTQRMRDIRAMMEATGIADSFVLDPSITRGLDYYTGVVYETFLIDLPSIGSVSSGGRYDNLTGLYIKDKIPGVGASIGLDRLIAGLEALGNNAAKASFTEAAVFCSDTAQMPLYQKVAFSIRSAGIGCEVYPDAKKMGQQYTWAEKKSIQWGITANQDGVLTLKNLATRETTANVNVDRIIKIITDKRS